MSTKAQLEETVSSLQKEIEQFRDAVRSLSTQINSLLEFAVKTNKEFANIKMEISRLKVDLSNAVSKTTQASISSYR